MPDGVPIFDHCLEQHRFRKLDGKPFNSARAVQQVVLGHSQGGRQVDRQVSEVFQVEMICLVVDEITRIDREESVASCKAGINVGLSFQVIRVSAKAVLPVFLENAPHGIVHHLLRRPTGARHLTNGLLSEDGSHLSLALPYSADMPGRGQPQAVTHAS